MDVLFDHSGLAGALAGGLIGLLGAAIGVLCGLFARRGKFKRLVLGLHLFSLGLCAALFALGIAAFVQGRPYAVWYGLGFPGLLGLIVFGSLLPVVRGAYRNAVAANGPKTSQEQVSRTD